MFIFCEEKFLNVNLLFINGFDLLDEEICFICFIVGKNIYWLFGFRIFVCVKREVFFMFLGILKMIIDLLLRLGLGILRVFWCNLCWLVLLYLFLRIISIFDLLFLKFRFWWFDFLVICCFLIVGLFENCNFVDVVFVIVRVIVIVFKKVLSFMCLFFFFMFYF